MVRNAKEREECMEKGFTSSGLYRIAELYIDHIHSIAIASFRSSSNFHGFRKRLHSRFQDGLGQPSSPGILRGKVTPAEM